MKRIIFVFLVLLALFAAFIVLAGSIRKLLLGESAARASAVDVDSLARPVA